ncbi:isochorismate synthase [Thermolongibacillus altinsuensis]|uniref:Isochorismate synthase MenF n=1 Tax=Thermolongibacillus altinsuensis TaxID=575256 RepID=A0A4R1QDN2_9BACL|nr:isochorismate synthase [Thermolongibacillus altinsuensis]TCL46515.1 isochorismate synthase [Thermolongibacillus altinsuensis]
MVTLYQNKVIDRLRDALTKKMNIVSVSMKVDEVDPLSFFEAGEKFFLGQRFYWSDCTNEYVFVGLGRTYVIQSDDQSKHRFIEIERKWKKILEGALIEREQDVLGTGPILFGGFAFDPLKRKTEKWINFPSARFILPSILLSKRNNETWLTVNVVDQSLEQLEEIIIHLFNGQKKQNNKDVYCLLKKEIEREKWIQAVKDVTSEIHDGKIQKVVLARELELMFNEQIDSARVLAALREQQPMSYIFAFENGSSCFLGASPEQLVKKEENVCETVCLAGSIKRGKTLKEDEQLGDWLLHDEKNRQEHQLVVDMICNAMNEVCDHVVVPQAPTLLKMRHIQHLYTPVKGYSKENVSILSLVERLHPTPALGGFPQEEAVRKIREIEPLDRGWYAAPIGWMDASGNGEFAVAIRSALIHENEAHLFAGCGIVAHSDAYSEYEETNVKFKPMLFALGGMDE